MHHLEENQIKLLESQLQTFRHKRQSYQTLLAVEVFSYLLTKCNTEKLLTKYISRLTVLDGCVSTLGKHICFPRKCSRGSLAQIQQTLQNSIQQRGPGKSLCKPPRSENNGLPQTTLPPRTRAHCTRWSHILLTKPPSSQLHTLK